MRIGIISPGRFHVLDLARELAQRGHCVRFYSYVPLRRALRFGLPEQCHRFLGWWAPPLVLLQRRASPVLGRFIERLLLLGSDLRASAMVEPCDVLIGMSGLCVRSLAVARARYRCRVVVERGSQHILAQQAILEGIPGMRRPVIPRLHVQRELLGYDLTDLIAVPSRHAEVSFLDHGFPARKLFRNPYGTDLRRFAPTVVPASATPVVVFSGTWCYRKGCDVLVQACSGLSLRLVHVGACGDAPLPGEPWFHSRGFVDQNELQQIYAGAQVMVLPSREDGFGVVLAQGLASGLPLVCSSRTGGPDIGELTGASSWITEVPPGNPVALRAGLLHALGQARRQTGVRDLLGAGRAELAWSAYARRYEERLEALMRA
jgi:starch synthase